MDMIVKGMIFSGVLRGQPLIEIYYHRLVGLIGFEPFRGTLDIKLEREIEFRKYTTKAVEHVLLDGTNVVNVRLAPVNLIIASNKYPCWAMQEAGGIYQPDVVEIIARDHIKQKFNVDDRAPVEVEFFEKPDKNESSVMKEKFSGKGGAPKQKKGLLARIAGRKK